MLIQAGRALRQPVFSAGLLFAAILTATGAFGTFRIVLPLRLIFWSLITLSAALSLVAASRLPLLSRPAWAASIARAALAAVPTTLVAVAAATALASGPIVPRQLVGYFPLALILNLLLLALMQLTAKREVLIEVEPIATPDDTVPEAIAAKLPPRLTRSRLLAVEAQDHYLRVAVRDGEALIHMRFGDALAALEGSDGTRVHRSWWVARTAIEAVSFASGRGELKLVDGTVVPVSRRFAPQAKALARRPKP